MRGESVSPRAVCVQHEGGVRGVRGRPFARSTERHPQLGLRIDPHVAGEPGAPIDRVRTARRRPVGREQRLAECCRRYDACPGAVGPPEREGRRESLDQGREHAFGASLDDRDEPAHRAGVENATRGR